MRRRSFLGGLAAVWVAGGPFPARSGRTFGEIIDPARVHCDPCPILSAPSAERVGSQSAFVSRQTDAADAGRAAANGRRLADAARSQVGVTVSYDPTWTHLSYPGGDVPRSTGVCADVVIRAARDALGLDLQKLVHEDMVKHFADYPARQAWGSRGPDANIDHRRVLNLETYWTRAGARLWAASGPVPGDGFPPPLEVGDIVTWLLDARLPHVGIVVSSGTRVRVVHNIGRGAEESPIEEFFIHRAAAHYRWPVSA